jgi:hypothetical protein
VQVELLSYVETRKIKNGLNKSKKTGGT